MPPVKRVKSGCITCRQVSLQRSRELLELTADRIRKVKCDEARPQCQRCATTGRKCDGYSILPFSRHELTAAASAVSRVSSRRTNSESLLCLVNDPTFSDILEKRSFQFFRAKLVPSANALLDSYFWNRTVLQACHATPAIKHAVLALSFWHQASGGNGNGNDIQHGFEYADEQYRMALHHARNLVASAEERDLDKILIACILFICFEAVRGHFRASQLHMDHGRAIFKENKGHFRKTCRRNDLAEITQALARLELPALGLSDLEAPYHYSLQDLHDTEPKLMLWEFRDVYEARTSLVDLSRWLLVIAHYLDIAYLNKDYSGLRHLQTQKVQASERLRVWHDSFEIVASRTDASCTLLILSLRLWFEACMIISDAGTHGPETRYDILHDRFRRVIVIGEEIVQRLAIQREDGHLSVSFEFGYLMPCFLVAQRCRDAILRRRALKLLLAIPRQEGTWGNYGAAAVAQRWMEIEEAGSLSTPPAHASFVPELLRIRYVESKFTPASRRGYIVFHFADEARRAQEELVEWGSLADSGPVGVESSGES